MIVVKKMDREWEGDDVKLAGRKKGKRGERRELRGSTLGEHRQKKRVEKR